MKLTEPIADLLDLAENGDVDVIVHQANLQHTFGAGIARAIRERLPYAYEADLRTPKGSPKKLGHYSIGLKANSPVVINLYSQTSLYPSHTSYDAMFDGLTRLVNELTPLTQINTVGFPYQIGCGLADGEWNVVKAIILSVFEKSRFEVVIAKLPAVAAKEAVDIATSDPFVDMMVSVGVDAFQNLQRTKQKQADYWDKHFGTIS